MIAATELTSTQVKVIEALLTGGTREETAKAAGCSERTVYRIQALPHVVTEIRRQRSKMLDATATVLAAGSATCVRILYEIARGEFDASTATRVAAANTRSAAARAILDLAARWEEQGALLARLEELERAAATVDQSQGKRGGWSQ